MIRLNTGIYKIYLGEIIGSKKKEKEKGKEEKGKEKEEINYFLIIFNLF